MTRAMSGGFLSWAIDQSPSQETRNRGIQTLFYFHSLIKACASLSRDPSLQHWTLKLVMNNKTSLYTSPSDFRRSFQAYVLDRRPHLQVGFINKYTIGDLMARGSMMLPD
ncbi:hypothetical protein O6H91_04G092000 [Diphasiastrum complanatum]|uniref:Uncharacterized protein n=1 Tax=Diphasiastrum complanatum TaxID=34168 RepID=A0ACC2DZQ1_DIPCM|nr:hypothetical protein O6H91_04G092000 [Diphasiastrum complanatum]